MNGRLRPHEIGHDQVDAGLREYIAWPTAPTPWPWWPWFLIVGFVAGLVLGVRVT